MTSPTSQYTAIERAFMLAAGGGYSGTGEIKAQLKVEGFSLHQITGPALLRQIRVLCIRAQEKKL